MMLTRQRRRITRYLNPPAAKVASSSSSPYSSSLQAHIKPKEALLHRTIAELINGQPLPWPPQLLSTLSALSPRLTQHTVVRALDLIKPPSTALKLFEWARRALPLDDRAHYKMLQVLCRCNNLSSATSFLLSLDSKSLLHDRFFNVLIRAHARSGEIRQSLDLFHRMRDEFGIPPSVFTFNSLLSSLLRRGWTRSATKLFHEMLRSRVSPDVCTFNILIRGFCLNSMADEAFRLFQEMERWRCEPDVMTYNALLEGLCRRGENPRARNLLEEMRQQKTDLQPTVISYTIVIRGYCGARCVQEAMDLFLEMCSSGIKPSRISYNTLLQGLCDAGRMDLIKEVMAREEWRDFKPDTCTFNTLITAHCNNGGVDDALQVFETMSSLKVKPDSATYSLLIRAKCQVGDFRAAESLLDEVLEKEVLSRSRGVPLMAAYNSIFEYLCKNGRSSKAGAGFKKLLLAKSVVDVASCKILIFGHCREGALREAHEIVAEMSRRELSPGDEAYETLIHGFLRKGDFRFAKKSLEKMLRSGQRPRTSTFHSVLSGVLRSESMEEACNLLKLMLERKIRPNLDLSTALVSKLFESDLRKEAFQVLGLLYQSGYGVKTEELIGDLCNSQKFLQARDLLLFCLKQPRYKVDEEICGRILKNLCQELRASEAFELFHELADMAVSISGDCLEDLEAALKEQEKLAQAKFVHRRRNQQVVGR